MSRIDESRPFKPVRLAVLTISDSRALAEDKSGNLLTQSLTEAGHTLADRKLVRDEVAEIQAAVKGWIADRDVDAIITTGGTGLTGRDVTPEAVRPLFEKEIDGFSVVMHLISFQKIGTSTVQSRSLAGVVNATSCSACPAPPAPAAMPGTASSSSNSTPSSPLQFRRDHAAAA